MQLIDYCNCMQFVKAISDAIFSRVHCILYLHVLYSISWVLYSVFALLYFISIPFFTLQWHVYYIITCTTCTFSIFSFFILKWQKKICRVLVCLILNLKYVVWVGLVIQYTVWWWLDGKQHIFLHPLETTSIISFQFTQCKNKQDIAFYIFKYKVVL